MKSGLFLFAIVLESIFPAAAAAKHPDQYLHYELTDQSSYTEGCFPPCLCPISVPAAVTGVFELFPLESGALADVYEVSSLFWTVSWPPGEAFEVLGCGTYTVGGEFAVSQRLELDLWFRQELLHFDSGWVDGGGTFREALDITVSMGNRECFDRVFEVHAMAAPADHVDFSCAAAGKEAVVNWLVERGDPIAKIEVWRDGEVVAKLDPGASEYREPALPGKHVYAAFATLAEPPAPGDVPAGTLFLGSCCVELPGGPRFVRGDCDGDGDVTGQVTDALFLLKYNFGAGPEPPCLAACDANADGEATGSVSDAVYLLLFNFLGGPPPPPPYPDCGTADDAALECRQATEGCW